MKFIRNYFEIFMLLPRIGFRGRDRVRIWVRARDRVRVSSNFTDCNHVEPPGQ